MKGKTKITVVGAGAWGTALAIHLAKKNLQVRLWVREADLLEIIENNRENEFFLPGIKIPEGVSATNGIGEAVCDAEIIFWAVPTQFLRSVVSKAVCSGATANVVLSKGIERGSNAFPMDIIMDVLNTDAVVVLSGPSFAEEVVLEIPTILVSASRYIELAETIRDIVSSPFLRCYSSDDAIGVSVGSALKNIIAIASGIIEGIGLGHNTRAALITRGLYEIARLASAMGARKETIFGIAGMGDLVLTCTSKKSRNYAVGQKLGKGERLESALSEIGHIAEGVYTTEGALSLAKKFGVELPITLMVHRILWEGYDIRKAVTELMTRPLKSEWEM